MSTDETTIPPKADKTIDIKDMGPDWGSIAGDIDPKTIDLMVSFVITKDNKLHVLTDTSIPYQALVKVVSDGLELVLQEKLQRLSGVVVDGTVLERELL